VQRDHLLAVIQDSADMRFAAHPDLAVESPRRDRVVFRVELDVAVAAHPAPRLGEAGEENQAGPEARGTRFRKGAWAKLGSVYRTRCNPCRFLARFLAQRWLNLPHSLVAGLYPTTDKRRRRIFWFSASDPGKFHQKMG
jgi:hypothetical protein